MEIVFVSLAAFGGAVVNGLLGWSKSTEKFDFRKFLPTFLKAVLAGAGIAIGYPIVATLGFWPGIVGAFLTGAGLDVLVHNVAGTIKK